MSAASTVRDSPAIASPSIEMAPSLIEMFSSPPSSRSARPAAPDDRMRTLWTTDAIHRANNLAQLATALGNQAARLPAGVLPAGAARIRALAAAYAKLGRRRGDLTPVACRALVRRVVTGLTDLFGRPNRIAVCFNGSEIFLPADARRALVLIASELVINSLKYAFPDGRPGVIDVSLWDDGGEGQLVVQDDGVGFVGAVAAGEGSGLVGDLATSFDATVGRSSCGGGHRVWTRFPVAATIAADASFVSADSDLLDRIDDAGSEFVIRAVPCDIDPRGHVADPVYLTWMNAVVARRCVHMAAEQESGGHLWIAVKHDITYRRPAFLTDPIRATTVVDRWQGSRARFATVFRRGDEILAEARSIWACLDPVTQRPIRMAAGPAHPLPAVPAQMQEHAGA